MRSKVLAIRQLCAQYVWHKRHDPNNPLLEQLRIETLRLANE